jgi:hypothetical protein
MSIELPDAVFAYYYDQAIDIDGFSFHLGGDADTTRLTVNRGGRSDEWAYVDGVWFKLNAPKGQLN